MKASILKAALLVAGISFLVSCQKDISGLPEENSLDSKAAVYKTKTQEHKLKGEYNDASYELKPGPGWVEPNPAPAWYPGVGEGHLNLLGKSTGFVNMYVTMGANGLQGTPAPVNLFFADEIISELGITIPDAVTILTFDKQGNSIWGSGVGTLPVIIESTTRATFSGKLNIIGGTGKFANASGEYYITGYFNPGDFQDAGIEVTDGTIIF